MAEAKSFVIWFQQRSGSSHLVSLLNSHPEIHCKGEMFGCFPIAGIDDPNQDSNGRQLGDRLYRRLINQFPGRIENPADRQCVDELTAFLEEAPTNLKRSIRGFKLKFPSQMKLFPEIVDTLRQQSSLLRVIVLTRKNYLRRAVSVLNLERIQQSTAQSNLKKKIQLPATRFDVSEVIRLIKYYQSIEAEFSSWPKTFEQRLQVEYEDLVSNQNEVTQQIQNFLGVSTRQELTSKVKRIAPAKMEDLVENSDELRAALKANQLSFEM